MKTERVAESFLPSGDGLAVFVKLNARYDSDLMNVRLKELLSDRGKSQEFKNAQAQIVALEKQVVNLQRQLGGTVQDEQIIQLREGRNGVLLRYDSIVRNLENLNSKTQRYAPCGMTMDEVQSILGPPRAINDTRKIAGIETWNYGEKWLKFQGGVVVAISERSNPNVLENIGCIAK